MLQLLLVNAARQSANDPRRFGGRVFTLAVVDRWNALPALCEARCRLGCTDLHADWENAVQRNAGNPTAAA